MVEFLAGQDLTAELLNSIFPAAVDDTQDATGNTITTATFTATLAGGGVACSRVFTAPFSGSVEVANTVEQSNSGVGFTTCGFEVRTGSVIGSGTLIQAASFEKAVQTVGTASERKTVVTTVSGLAVGVTHHVRQMFRVQSGTGTYLRKTLSVKPLT